MRIRSVLSHSAQVVVEGALISLLVVGLMAGTAFAARGGGGGHKTTGPVGTCTASPAAVAAGGVITVSGSGLKANLALNVWVSSSTGTQILPTATDGSGNYTRAGYAFGTGTDNVSVHDMFSGAILQACSFQVQ